MFEVIVESDSPNVISLQYPEDVLNGHKKLKKVYSFQESSIIVDIYEGDSPKVVRKISYPEYAKRVIITFDVMIELFKRNINGFIKFNYNGNRTKNIKKIIRTIIPIDSEYYDQENKLLKIVLESIISGVPFEENDESINYGYGLMIDFLCCGGLK